MNKFVSQGVNNESMIYTGHTPALLKEALEALQLKKGQIIADCTLGLGGHSQSILQALGRTGKLIAIEQDAENLKRAKKNLAEFQKQIIYLHGNFGDLEKFWTEQLLPQVNGFLFDLGIASVHLDEADRGFSFKKEGALDMRMNQKQSLTAAEIVNQWKEAELAQIFWRYGEEKMARKIAAEIVQKRKQEKIVTTTQLADLIAEIKPQMRWGGGHPAAQVFQALRIAVNHELEVLERGLKSALKFLQPGGRLVVISYHSLEDRIVKNFFKLKSKSCVCPAELPVCRCGGEAKFKIIGKIITPSDAEISLNPRARSARMRIMEKINLKTKNLFHKNKKIK